MLLRYTANLHIHLFIMKERMKRLWMKKWIRWTIILAVVAGLFLLFAGGNDKQQIETFSVARRDVAQTVITTGQVKPREYASLRFKTSGTISRMLVTVGDKVAVGQTLAVLDTSELSKKVTQARAEVTVAEVAVENSAQDFGDKSIQADHDVSSLYEQASTRFSEILNLAQQAYASYVTFFDDSFHIISSIANTIVVNQFVVDANNSRPAADSAMSSLRSRLENFSAQASRAEIDATLSAIHEPLQKLQFALTTVINVISAVPTGSISATTLDTYKTTLSTARTNLTNAISKEITLATSIQDAVIDGRLSTNTASATRRTAVANLEKAKAALAIAEQNLADAYIKAPFSGTIAMKSKQMSELVTNTDQVYYLIGEGGLEVIANVPEVDIAKLAIGNETAIKLDAYGKETVFSAKITDIDPAETIVDGIATYRVTFAFMAPDEKIRSGMTADIKITTATKTGVLAIPVRAVKGLNGDSLVQVRSGEVLNDVPVKLGLRGSDGFVEVLEGLTEGQEIVVSLN